MRKDKLFINLMDPLFMFSSQAFGKQEEDEHQACRVKHSMTMQLHDN